MFCFLKSKLFCLINSHPVIHYMLHCHVMGERGVCEVTNFYFRFIKIKNEMIDDLKSSEIIKDDETIRSRS